MTKSSFLQFTVNLFKYNLQCNHCFVQFNLCAICPLSTLNNVHLTLCLLTKRGIQWKCSHIYAVDLDCVLLHVQVAGGVVPQVQLSGHNYQDDLHTWLKGSRLHRTGLTSIQSSPTWRLHQEQAGLDRVYKVDGSDNEGIWENVSDLNTNLHGSSLKYYRMRTLKN